MAVLLLQTGFQRFDTTRSRIQVRTALLLCPRIGTWVLKVQGFVLLVIPSNDSQKGIPQKKDIPTWAGSKLNRRGYAGFGPCFHLPGFHFGYRFFEPQPYILECPESFRIPIVIDCFGATQFKGCSAGSFHQPKSTRVWLYMCLHIHIYIYIYIHNLYIDTFIRHAPLK